LLSLVSTIRGTKLKVKTSTTTLTKITFPKLTAMWRTRCDACKKKNVRCNRKATFYYKGKLQEVFRAGLNEIKYDQWRTQKISMGRVSFRGIWWSFAFGVRCSWRHNL